MQRERTEMNEDYLQKKKYEIDPVTRLLPDYSPYSMGRKNGAKFNTVRRSRHANRRVMSNYDRERPSKR